MKTVADILQKGPQFNVVEADTKVVDALSTMKMHNLSYLIVNRNGNYEGIVTERDYAQKIVLMGRASTSTTVGEIMSTNLPIVNTSETIENCMKLMNAHKTRYLPVFDQFDFKAVITMNDLIRMSINSKEHEELVGFSSDKVF